MSFFSSLTYTGTRVGGQRERQTQAFEAGCAYFPRDFPATQAYAEYAEDRAEEELDTWERKPPAKRPNYEKLGTRSPWRPDWDVVLGLEEPAAGHSVTTKEGEAEMLDTQRDVVMERTSAPASTHASELAIPVPTAGQDRKIRAWLLRGADVPAIVAEVSSMLNPATGLLMRLNQARAKRKLDPLHSSIRAEDLLRTALVQVALNLCGRGCPDDLAIIYRVDDTEARKWMTAEARKKSGLALLGEGPDETEVSCIAETGGERCQRYSYATACSGRPVPRGHHRICNHWQLLVVVGRGTCSWRDSFRPISRHEETGGEVSTFHVSCILDRSSGWSM